MRGFTFLMNQVVIGTVSDKGAIGDQLIEQRLVLLIQFRHIRPLRTRNIPCGNVGVNDRLAFCHLRLQRTDYRQCKT
jgi:hypothetical protein